VPYFTRVVAGLLLAPILRAKATPPPPGAFGPLATGVVVPSDTEDESFACRDAGLCR